jgi:hypothetical protein
MADLEPRDCHSLDLDLARCLVQQEVDGVTIHCEDSANNPGRTRLGLQPDTLARTEGTWHLSGKTEGQASDQPDDD